MAPDAIAVKGSTLRVRFNSKRQRLALIASLVSAVALGVSGAAILAPSRAAHATQNYSYLDSHWYKLGRDDAQYQDSVPPSALLAEQQAADLAYPANHVAPAQMEGAVNAFQNVERGNSDNNSWTFVGPSTANVAPSATYSGSASITSGRVTAIGVGSHCGASECVLYVGAAGGGIWRTHNALATTPTWTSVMNGLYTNAIGSIWVDPSNANHVLVGTGEANGSSDSEAGYGLFQTFNGGGSWSLVRGSFDVAAGRAIASIAVDPSNRDHLFIGTAVARHGAAAVSGGRYTPPNPPQIGLYESTDGGSHFTLAFSRPSDPVNPASPTGSDFFRGDVQQVAFDPTTRGRVYLAISDYGLYRSDGHGGYEQVYAAAYQGNAGLSSVDRVQFALAPLGDGHLRIYLGDAVLGTGQLFRTDNAGAPAATLTDGTNNPGWLALSSATNGTPGYASYNFCEGQCWYDMFVVSPAGSPNNVWIGGSFAYGEQFGRSNGRAVMRSTNAGASFTDMTNDMQFNGMHPDQHALAFDPANPDIAFVGSDGGLVRTSGQFANMAADPSTGCAARGLTTGANSVDCNAWLSAVPTQIFNMNAGLATLQFQSVAVDAHNINNLIGGTQDNGTLVRQGTTTTWTQTIGGDGGQSGINVADPSISFHSYYGAAHDVNFNNGAPLSWDWIADPLGNNEGASFYVPAIYDPNPANAGYIYEGEQHIFRTTDNGGNQALLDQHCNEFTGDFAPGYRCGDWQPMGGQYADPTNRYPSTVLNDQGDLSGTYWGTDKGGSSPSANYVVAISRASSDTSTLWAATRFGRVFITLNANAANAQDVTFTRIDNSNTPTRFVSGIAVDPKNPFHAFISYSGYDAYATAAGTATGHVFEVWYNPNTGKATWKDISNGLGDQPILGVAYDAVNGDLYVATSFGVLRAVGHSHWVAAGAGLPLVAVYGITLAGSGNNEALYAATHGRGVYSLNLSREHGD